MTYQGVEKQFEALFIPFGKKAFVYRVTDSAEVQGMSGTKAFTKPQPSDYIVTVDGDMAYYEVKSTVDPKKFKRSLIRDNQISAAKQQLAAGGKYFVVVRSLTLSQWFKIPASFIINSLKASWSWPELAQFNVKGV